MYLSHLSCVVFNTQQDDHLKYSGVGRRVVLSTPVSLSDLVERVKRHLGLQLVRLAKGKGSEDATLVNSIAICAGSG